MNGLAHKERRAGNRMAARRPLTMTWQEQLIAEAESAVRRAGSGAELERAVWALAKVAYGHMERMMPGELLSARDETVARKLADSLALSEGAAKLLLGLSGRSGCEEAESAGKTEDTAERRELRKLAARLIQYSRSTRRAPAAIR